MRCIVAKLAAAFTLVSLATLLTGCGQGSGKVTPTRQTGHKITIIGSGNWGSVAARIAAQNALKHTDIDDEVRMWVHEEIVYGRNLSDIINERHENVKYLPGIALPDNLKAVPDLAKAVSGASLLVFVLPHQFVKGLTPTIKSAMAPDAKAISLIKGWDVNEDGFQLISSLIEEATGLETSVLMGANVAGEIALEEFSEATVGYKRGQKASGDMWQRVFNTNYFSVTAVPDVAGCELCGTMKNIVALGAGFVDGLGLGGNTKAAIIRIGLKEMRSLAKKFFPSVLDETFFESAGVADLITTCYGGRNRKCAEAYTKSWKAKKQKTWEQIEKDELGGQKLQGVLTSNEVQEILRRKDLEGDFPLLTTINRISKGDLTPDYIIRYADHPGDVVSTARLANSAVAV